MYSMEPEAVETLKESLRLNQALDQRFAKLGDFGKRVESLRAAKLFNDGQIDTLKQQIARLEGRLLPQRAPAALIFHIPPAPAPVPPRAPVPAPPPALPTVTNNWHSLRDIVVKAHPDRKVGVVGKGKKEVLLQLEARFGRQEAAALVRRIAFHRKIERGPEAALVIFTRARQTPQSVQRLLRERAISQPVHVVHKAK